MRARGGAVAAATMLSPMTAPLRAHSVVISSVISDHWLCGLAIDVIAMAIIVAGWRRGAQWLVCDQHDAISLSQCNLSKNC